MVTNTRDYSDKILEHLQDENTYKRITDRRRNPTANTEKELNKLHQEIKNLTAAHDDNKKQLEPKTIPLGFTAPTAHLRPFTVCQRYTSPTLPSDPLPAQSAPRHIICLKTWSEFHCRIINTPSRTANPLLIRSKNTHCILTKSSYHSMSYPSSHAYHPIWLLKLQKSDYNKIHRNTRELICLWTLSWNCWNSS